MADNSDALARARAHDSRTKRQRAAQSLETMDQAGLPITFPAVARHADVSVSLLYADRDLAARIAAARDRQRQAGNQPAWRLPTRSLITEQSLRTDLANATQRARRLEEEVGLLRQQLARQLGADADLARDRGQGLLVDQLEQRATELEADNHTQRQRILQLETSAQELTDTLAAARATNRQLLSQLNRTGAQAQPHADS